MSRKKQDTVEQVEETFIFGVRKIKGGVYYQHFTESIDAAGKKTVFEGVAEPRPVVFERLKIAMMKLYMRGQ